MSKEVCGGSGAVESQSHIFRFTKPTLVQTRKAAWNALKKDVKKMVHPLVLQRMWWELSGVFGGSEPECGPVYSTEEEGLNDAFKEQSQIGWEHMVYGHISKE